MKFSKKLLLASIVAIGLFACSEDDDSVEPNNNGSNNSTTLMGGTWEAFEFKDSKGSKYGLNEWIPEYDTIDGCEVVLFQEKYIKDELKFYDSTLILESDWEDRYRNHQKVDTSCNSIVYGNWTSYTGGDTTELNYEVSGGNIIIWEDLLSTPDTVPYAIRNGLLYIYEGTEDEYYYRKK